MAHAGGRHPPHPLSPQCPELLSERLCTDAAEHRRAPVNQEILQLPEPAATLLATAFETMDSALGPVVPAGHRWRLGGGTLLAARWRHRRSTDLDIFLPSDSGIAILDPRWNPDFANAMRRIGATSLDVVTNSLKFSFPSGRIEITQLDPIPDLPVIQAVADGHEIAVYHNACVLTGKLHGRGARLPARDVFDIGVARDEDPDALRTAVNTIDSNLRAEILHLLRVDAAGYAEGAAEAIIDPAPQWEHLVVDGLSVATAAIEQSTYERVDIEYATGAVQLDVHARDGWRIAERFESGQALATAMLRLGLGAIMHREHRTVVDFVRSADALIAESSRSGADI